MGYPFVVRSYKVVNSTDQITVDYQGSTLTLALKQSKIASTAQAGGPGQLFGGRTGAAPAPAFGARAGGPAQPLAPAELAAQDAARLQAAAIDFQQRQAQRQQAQAALQANQAAQQMAPAGQQGGGQRAQRNNGTQQQNGQQPNNGGNRRAVRGQ